MHLKKELKITMAIDNYKIPKKSQWWKVSMKKLPSVKRFYDFVKEENSRGLSPNTTFLHRYYVLKTEYIGQVFLPDLFNDNELKLQQGLQ